MKEPFRSCKTPNPALGGTLFFLLLCPLMLSGIHLSFAAEQVPLKRVHVIYGLNPNFPAHQLFTKGLQDKFGQSSDKFQIEYSFEYLDLGLGQADENYRALLAEFLKRKYSLKSKPDLIIAHLTPANLFLAKYAEEIMPGIPVVYTGDQPGMIPAKDIPLNFAGIVREGNPAPAVSLILQAQPDTRKIYIVMGDSLQEKKIRLSFPKDLAMFADKVEMVYLNQLPFPRMMEIIKGIRGPSVILYISYFQDVTGHNFVPAKVAGIISRSANVPTYGISAPYMGQGVVGGYQFSAQVVGEKAAELGTKVLLGSRISDFPREQTAATAEYRFDWRALKRWGIDENRLPRESKFEHRTPTFWDAYKWHIIGGLILFLLETFLIFLLLINIKKRKKGEEVLRESEEQYRTLFENAGEAIFVAQDDRVVFVNPTTITITGYAGEEIASRPFTDFIHADDRDMVIDRHVRRLKGESIPPRYSFRVLPKNGGFRWVELDAVIINWKGKPATLNFMNDITDRRRAEETLRRSEEKYRTIIEEMVDGYFEVDLAGNYTFVNEAETKNMGYSRDELIGMNNRQYQDEKNARKTYQAFRRIYETGEPVKSLEVEISRKDGTKGFNEISVSLKKDREGKPIGFQGFTHDITDRKNSMDRIRKALGGTVQAIALVVEAKDPYTAGHQRRVADISRAIATEMGLPHERIEGIRMASIIHDIGKVSVPAEILSMPRKLTALEFSLIQTHAQSGYEVLKDIEFPWPIARMVLEHHERMNGSGYPQGLKGEDILMESRILAVADVVEAMATHRPYRAALGIDKALEEITQNKGILYDPEVVDACLRLFREKGYEIKG